LKIIPQLTISAVDLVAALLFMYGSSVCLSGHRPFRDQGRRIGMAVAILASFLYAFDVGATAKPS